MLSIFTADGDADRVFCDPYIVFLYVYRVVLQYVALESLRSCAAVP